MSQENPTSGNRPALPDPTTVQRESFFMAVFLNAPFAISLVRLKDCVIADVNPAWEKMFGISWGEAVGSTSIELGLIPDEAEYQKRYEETRSSGSLHDVEMLKRTKDGATILTLNNAEVVTIDRTQYILTTMVDITERKRTEAALALSERRFREIIQYAPAVIYEIDFRTGLFLEVNDVMVELSGYSREELLQMTGFDLLEDEGRVLFKERIQRLLLGEKLDETVEYRVKTKSGRTLYAVLNSNFTRDESGKTVGATVVAHDVTERKLAEIELHKAFEALRESESRFRQSIENLNEAFAILNAFRQDGAIADFRFEYVNEAACRMMWRSQEEFVGHTFLELYAQDSANGIFDRFAGVVETGRPVQERLGITPEDVGSAKVAAQRVIDIRCSKFEDGLIVTANDVTEQARLETEHREALMQMEIHHRLSEQREMERQSYARDIHDGPIQTLSSLAFNLQYLKEVYPDPALKVELDQIGLSVKGAVQELRQLINELRPPSVLRFGLSRAIEFHAENLRERYPQVQWNLKLASERQRLPEQTCLALFRIYQEAVNNIVRHSEASKAWVTFKALKSEVVLEIKDNGKGFAGGQDIVRLTSLQHFGLAGMVERAEAIGGKVKIDSKPGQGTTVRVRVAVKAVLPPAQAGQPESPGG